MVGGLQPQLLF